MPGEPTQLTRALRYAIHIESLLAVATLALVVSVLDWLATLPWSAPELATPLARALPSVYFYLVLHKTATGSMRLPQRRDYRDTWDTLIGPLLRLAPVSLYYWIAVLFAADRVVGLEAFLRRFECRPSALFRMPQPAALLALGLVQLYLPAALVTTVVRRRTLWHLDPTFGLRTLRGAAGDYLRTFASLCLLTVVLFTVDTVARAFQRAVPIPLAAPVMGQMLVLWIPLAQAHLLGRFTLRFLARDEPLGSR